MKIPKRVRIGGKIVRVSRSMRHAHKPKQLEGYYDAENEIIWINPDSKDPANVFLHEFLHACFKEAGVHQTDSWHFDIEEILCEKMAGWILDLIN